MSASASATTPPTTTTPVSTGGRLYICGRTGGKAAGGIKTVHPVNGKYCDNHGHTPYPHLLTVSDKSVRFSQVKGEHISISAALEASPNPGGLWCWSADSTEVVNCIPKGVVSFAVGKSFALAALHDGSLVIIGSYDPTNDTPSGNQNHLVARPFQLKPPAGVTFVSASEDTIAIVCGDAGEVYTLGPHPVANGHGESVTEEWKKIQLIPIAATSSSDSSSTTAAAAPTTTTATSTTKKVKAVSVGQGSLTGGAVTACGKVFLWGDGISGTLGTGSRVKHSPNSVAICHDFPAQFNDPAVHVAFTTSQLNPKRTASSGSPLCGPGQEGGRTHVVTKSGALYICGTTHKGLAANCLYKTLGQDHDLLSFYKVGGHAMDYKTSAKCPTGAAEDLARREGAPKEVVAKRLGMESADLLGKDHDTNYLTEPGLKIISSSVTHIHSAAVSEDGRCFTWGCGSDGRTGLHAFMRGPSGSKRLMKCYISSPSVVEALEEKKVLDACACRNYTLFVVA